MTVRRSSTVSASGITTVPAVAAPAIASLTAAGPASRSRAKGTMAAARPPPVSATQRPGRAMCTRTCGRPRIRCPRRSCVRPSMATYGRDRR